MSRTFLLSTLFSGSIALTLGKARAEPSCAPRADVLAKLAQEFGEERRSIALAESGVVVETFASQGGSWTVLVTRPDGTSCLLASGPYFEEVDEPLLRGEPS